MKILTKVKEKRSVEKKGKPAMIETELKKKIETILMFFYCVCRVIKNRQTCFKRVVS